MTRSKKEVWEAEAELWYDDAIRAALAGDPAEYTRCMRMYESYKADLRTMEERL